MKIIFALILGMLGILLTVLLLSYHLDKESNLIPAVLCGGKNGCHAALESRWSEFPPKPILQGADDNHTRIPVALLGLWHFTFITLWLMLIGRPRVKLSILHWIPIIELFAACAIAGFFISIIVVEKTFCPLCIASHVCTFIITVLFIRMLPDRSCEPSVSLRWPSLKEDENKYVTITIFLFLTTAVIQWQWTTYEKKRHSFPMANSIPKQVNINSPMLKEFFKQKVHSIPIGQDDIVINSEGAEYGTVVLFIDLRCQPCHAFHKFFMDTINSILFDRKLRIVYKHFPLCKDCNPISSNEHPQACNAAYLAEAAKRQQGFEGFEKIHSFLKLIDEKTLDHDDYLIIARLAGLDSMRFRKDFSDITVREKVRKDIELAISLEVKGTPAIFLNNRFINSNLMVKWEFWKEIASYLDQDKDYQITSRAIIK